MKTARIHTETRHIAETVKAYLNDYYPGKVRIIEERLELETNLFGDENNIDISVEIPYNISPYDAVTIGKIIGSMKVKKEVDETGAYSV